MVHTLFIYTAVYFCLESFPFTVQPHLEEEESVQPVGLLNWWSSPNASPYTPSQSPSRSLLRFKRSGACFFGEEKFDLIIFKSISHRLRKKVCRQTQQHHQHAYGAPVMFVPKPDGTLRMVLDYRDLNAQTVKDRYPLPRDQDLFDQLQVSQAKFLSSIDLLYGYWQVLIHPDDIHKTAIRTPRARCGSLLLLTLLLVL